MGRVTAVIMLSVSFLVFTGLMVDSDYFPNQGEHLSIKATDYLANINESGLLGTIVEESPFFINIAIVMLTLVALAFLTVKSLHLLRTEKQAKVKGVISEVVG